MARDSLLGITVIVVSLALTATALAETLGLIPLPWPLIGLDERLPGLFRVHMAAAGLALCSICVAAILRRHPGFHRPIGRFAVIMVAIGAVSALPSALLSEASPFARASFFAQGLVWLGLAIAGYRAIRAQERDRHRRLMLMMAAVASGAIWLRLMTAAIAAFHLPAEETYALAAWSAWLLPLAAVGTLTRPRRHYKG